VICRSAVKPIFVGLGTAAILAAGGASAIADSPSPSDSGSTTPAVANLVVGVTATPSPDAGDPVDIAATVEAEGGAVAGVTVKSIAASPETADLTGQCVKPFPADSCRAGDGNLASGEKDTFNWSLKAPKTVKQAKVTIVVGGTDVDDVTKTSTITYVMPTPTKTATPTKTPTKKPTKTPSPSATSTSSSGSSGSSGSGSSGSSGSGSSGGSTSGGGGGYSGPSPNSSFDAQNPQVALPPIQAPNPSVAPSPVPGSGTPQSRLQGNKAPVAQDLTFERMASTQIAWLAALMVAFSLLLTQLRLGRRRLPAGASRHIKGTHRRPRHGMFGR
jgi:hypothetical protein